MAYVDYEFYQNTYLGRLIPQQEFAPIAARAESYLDYLCRNRIRGKAEDLPAVKAATCAVAEAYWQNQSGGGVASEKVGDWAINYVVGVSKAKTEEQRLLDAAKLHLANTSLLGRWLK